MPAFTTQDVSLVTSEGHIQRPNKEDILVAGSAAKYYSPKAREKKQDCDVFGYLDKRYCNSIWKSHTLRGTFKRVMVALVALVAAATAVEVALRPPDTSTGGGSLGVECGVWSVFAAWAVHILQAEYLVGTGRSCKLKLVKS